MKENKKRKQLLYRSFDQELNPAEQAILAQALENSPALRQEKEDILALRTAAATTAVHSFKPFFADRVMEKINRYAGKPNGLDVQAFYDSLVYVFRRFALAGALASIILFIFTLRIGELLSVEEAIIMPDLTVREILSIFL